MSEYQTKSSSFLALLFIAGLVVGGMISSYIAIQENTSLKNEVSNLQSLVSKLWGSQTIINNSITVYQNGSSLSEIYAKVKDSVVLIYVQTSVGAVQGSGFVYNYTYRSMMVIVTNYHVVHNAVNISITFPDGEGYEATVLGTDPYADLAILKPINVPEEKFKPLTVVSSSTLQVGDPVIAIGNPYGLVGSMTTGIISALGRTIVEEEYAGRFAIANIIQTSAPINPGNSGGPLLNILGEVVGITTAIIENSQGLGFAIPSNTLQREVFALIEYGNYTGHSYLGIEGRDMSYETAKQLGLNVTYGWWVTKVIEGDPSYGQLQEGDVIIALNGTKIRNGDDMSSYLEEKTLPGETLILTVIRRDGETLRKIDLPVVLGRRPPPPV